MNYEHWLLLLVLITTVVQAVALIAALLLLQKHLESVSAILNSRLLAVQANISGIASAVTDLRAMMYTSQTSARGSWSALRTDTTSQTHKGR